METICGESKTQNRIVGNSHKSRNISGLKRGNTVNVGRPKGLRERVLTVTKDGKLLVDEFKRIAFDESEKTSDRLAALEWLSDRGYGKAINLSADVTPSDEQKDLAVAIAKELLKSN